MKTIMVDDELWSMEFFVRECSENSFFDIVGTFTNPLDALAYAEKNEVEFALLDIEMFEMDGITLGKKLKELYPSIIIIYVSAHGEKAAEVMKIKADYYVMKPYSVEDVEDAVERVKMLSKRQNKKIFINTFGNFDVFVDGKAIVFPSPKAKEALAVLVDRKGGVVTAQDAFYLLWEDKPFSKNNVGLCHKAFARLLEFLDESGIPELVISEKFGKHLNMDVVDCDYYLTLEGDKNMMKRYDGRYLVEYSWAEETNSYLTDLLLN